MWKTGWSLPINMSICLRLEIWSNAIEVRWGQSFFRVLHSVAGVFPVILSRTLASTGLRSENNPFMEPTEQCTRLDCFLTSVLPVPEIVKFCLSPFSCNSSAALSVIYDPVEQGSNITLTFNFFGPFPMTAGKIINKIFFNLGSIVGSFVIAIAVCNHSHVSLVLDLVAEYRFLCHVGSCCAYNSHISWFHTYDSWGSSYCCDLLQDIRKTVHLLITVVPCAVQTGVSWTLDKPMEGGHLYILLPYFRSNFSRQAYQYYPRLLWVQHSKPRTQLYSHQKRLVIVEVVVDAVRETLYAVGDDSLLSSTRALFKDTMDCAFFMLWLFSKKSPTFSVIPFPKHAALSGGSQAFH